MQPPLPGPPAGSADPGMGEDLARRQTVARLTRLCETAMRLLDDQASPTIIASSSHATCNWHWDEHLQDPYLGRGTVRLRLSRRGGTHHLSVHEGDAAKALTRITEDERLAPIGPVAPSKVSMLAAIERMRDALASDHVERTSDHTHVCTALAYVAHPTADVFRIARGNGNGAVWIESHDRNGTTMRRWAHPARPGWGTFSEPALRALGTTAPCAPSLMIESGGLSGRSRRTSCLITPSDTACGTELDPMEALRIISCLPAGAMLLPPSGIPS